MTGAKIHICPVCRKILRATEQEIHYSVSTPTCSDTYFVCDYCPDSPVVVVRHHDVSLTPLVTQGCPVDELPGLRAAVSAHRRCP